MNNNENTKLIILICCIAALGGFLFGFDSGVINGTVDGLQQAFGSSSGGTGFNVSSMLLGCALGAFFAGRLADNLGRRPLLIITALLFIVSAWGSGISSSSIEFVIYRVIGGLAVGAASVMTPAYISEIAPARYRGSLATVQQLAIIFGLFSAFVSNYLLANAADGSAQLFWYDFAAWRWMFWIELIPACLFFTALIFIPESPRYLIMAGKSEAGTDVLTRLFGSEAALNKVADIQQSHVTNRQPKLVDLIEQSKNRLRPIVWLGIGLATFQQFLGINVVFYYGAVLWQAAGFSEADALLINIISGAVSIFAVFITIYMIDKVGRKPLLLTGSIGMTASLLMLVFCFVNASVNSVGNLELGNMGLYALIAANIYVFFFNLSWGPIMWVLLGEMFPNQIRGSGLAVAGLFQWLSNFLITWSFPVMLTGIGLAGAYGFYAFCALLSILFVVKWLPETKGKELEDMPG